MNQQDEWTTDFDSVDAVESNLIPNSRYRMALEKVSQERVKSGENVGKPQANCQFTVTDERQHGRKVFQYFAPHVPFQSGMVKALAIATNTPLQPSMYNLLVSMIGKEFMATVGSRKSSNPEYPDSNVINGIKPLPILQNQPVYTPAHPPQQAYAPAPPVQPQQPIRTGQTAFSQDGKPIFLATNGSWYLDQ